MSIVPPITARIVVNSKRGQPRDGYPGLLSASRSRHNQIVLLFESDLNKSVSFELSHRGAWLLMRAIHDQLGAAQDPEEKRLHSAQSSREAA